MTRNQALAVGEKHYMSTEPCPEGHRLRFVSNKNCVICMRRSRKPWVKPPPKPPKEFLKLNADWTVSKLTLAIDKDAC